MTPSVSFTALLQSALTEPGNVSKAYHAFHGYSLGNQLLALVPVCRTWHHARTDRDVHGLEGERPVRPQGREGDHAVSARHGQAQVDRRQLGRQTRRSGRRQSRRGDVYPVRLPAALVRAEQTDGQDVEPVPIPDWDRARALDTLGIIEEPFTS